MADKHVVIGNEIDISRELKENVDSQAICLALAEVGELLTFYTLKELMVLNTNSERMMHNQHDQIADHIHEPESPYASLCGKCEYPYLEGVYPVTEDGKKTGLSDDQRRLTSLSHRMISHLLEMKKLEIERRSILEKLEIPL